MSAEVPASATVVGEALRRLFNDAAAPAHTANRFPEDDWLHAFTLAPVAPDPEARQRSLPADAVLRQHAGDNPALERYLHLDPADRQLDLYLRDPVGTRYWHSEYRYAADGGPVEFSCAFLFHLEPLAAARTRLEVIEILPRVRAGRKWAFLAHGVGIGRVQDIRNVPPTTRDRVALLELALAAVENGTAPRSPDPAGP